MRSPGGLSSTTFVILKALCQFYKYLGGFSTDTTQLNLTKVAAKSTHHILSHITAAEVAWQLDGGYEIFFPGNWKRQNAKWNYGTKIEHRWWRIEEKKPGQYRTTTTLQSLSYIIVRCANRDSHGTQNNTVSFEICFVRAEIPFRTIGVIIDSFHWKSERPRLPSWRLPGIIAVSYNRCSHVASLEIRISNSCIYLLFA